jgi:putative copper resistance protein D
VALLPWLARFRSALVCILGLIAAFLVASLAWAGHGLMAPAVSWHLTADVLHLLVCGLWPLGLLPFFLLIWSSPQLDVRIVRRFSTLSALSVVALALTGLVNTLILVRSPCNLTHTSYGQVLMLKIGLFAVMIGLGASNRLYLLPRLAPASGSAAASLRRSVFLELLLAAAVLVIVGYLGRLAPPVHLMHHHHHSAAVVGPPSVVIQC